jgi:hypothetical protein
MEALIFTKNIKNPELSTSMLLGLLSQYKDPRKQLHTLVKKKWVKPVKQGIYILNESFGLRPYSTEVIANMIYGPSYISLEMALSSYGLIPERVETITSVCYGNSRSFDTDLGLFEFAHIKSELYPLGVTVREIFENTFCQFATPEKALTDFIYLRERVQGFESPETYFLYLQESYRFDLHSISQQISKKKLLDLARMYQSKRVDWFASELGRRLGG